MIKNINNGALTYNDLIDNMELEYEDFWHSDILSWRKGIVKTINHGNVPVKCIVFDEVKEGRNIQERRMYRVRIPV